MTTTFYYEELATRTGIEREFVGDRLFDPAIDVRSDSLRRVAPAAGEGSKAVRFVHEYLREN